MKLLILTLYSDLEGNRTTTRRHIIGDYARYEFRVFRAPTNQVISKLSATKIKLGVCR